MSDIPTDKIRKTLGLYPLRRPAERAAERYRKTFPSRGYEVTPTQHGMFKLEEIEQATEEARKKEQETKEELKMAKEQIERRVLRAMAEMIEDETDARAAYTHIANMLITIGLEVAGRQVREFAIDEGRHYDALNRLFSAISGASFKGRKT